MAPAGLSRRSHALSAGNGGAQPSACLGFGWRGHQLTPDSMDLPLHLELPGFRIQVIPLEGADHTPAQAGGQLGEKVPPHLVLLNGLQKGAQLFPIQNLLWEVIGL